MCLGISAHADLYYPHVASNDFWETEICVMNTGAQELIGTFMIHDDEGNTLSEGLTVTLKPGGRRMVTVGMDFMNADVISYMVFETNSEEVAGYTKFFIEGAYRVAVPAVKKINTGDIFISHIASDTNWWTGIAMVNTSWETKNLTFQFNTGDVRSIVLGPKEHIAFPIEMLFEEGIPADIESAVIKNGSGVVGLELFGSNDENDQYYLSGILLNDLGAKTMYYPHIAGDGMWWTGVVAANFNESETQLTVKPFTAGGAQLGSQVISLGPGQKYVGTPETLSLPAGTAWFLIESTGNITGFELFGTRNGKQLAGYTSVNIQNTSGVFSKIETDGWTGIAFVNSENADASVTLYAMDDSGTVIATANEVLGPFEKRVSLAADLFSNPIHGATYIRYVSTRTVVGFQLNGSNDGMMLDALPGLTAHGSVQTTPVTAGDVEIPSDEPALIQTYNEVVWDYTVSLQDLMEDNYDLLDIASNGFTETIDSYQMSDTEMDQFSDTMDQMLPDMALTLLYSYDLSKLEANLSKDSVVQKSLHTARYRQPRLLISGSLAIAGAALTIKSLYDYGFESYEKQFKIAEDVIQNTSPGSKEHRRINSELGLDEDTPKDETFRNFKQESFFRKNRLSKAVIQANSIEGDDTATEKRRNTIKNTANEGGAVAVKTTVGLATTATGGQGVDKIAKAAGASEPVAGLIDLYVTHKGSQPLDVFAENVTVSVQSKNTKEVSVPESEMPLPDAKKMMKDVAAGDFSDVVDPRQLIDAFNAILNTIAKNVPGAAENPDGSVRVKVPESIHIENRTELKNGEAIKVPGLGESGVTVTAEGKKPESIEDVDLTFIADLVLEAEKILNESPSPSLSLSAVVTDEDALSVTYLVSAEVTEITGTTRIEISVENASTSGSTKTLTSDGAVSWSVTVLDKDGMVTVRRQDTDEQKTIILAGKSADYDGTYSGSFVTTYEAEDAWCWDSGELTVYVSGNSLTGDASGTLNGNAISGTGEYGMIFSGSINGNLMSGSWHDPEGGCAGTFSLTRQ